MIPMNKNNGYTPTLTLQQLNEKMIHIIKSVWRLPMNFVEQGSEDSVISVNNLLVCKSIECPYRTVCDIPAEDLEGTPTNFPCLHELIISTTQLVKYCEYFELKAGDTVDFEQIRQLVDIEVKLLRCDKFTAINPEMIYAPAEDGSSEKKLHPVALHELSLMKAHSRLLKDLAATRDFI